MLDWTRQLFLLGVTLVCAGLGNEDLLHDFFNIPHMCTNNSQCAALHRFAVCANYDDPVALDPADQLIPVIEDDVITSSDDGSGDVTDMTTASIPDVMSTPAGMKRCRCNADEGYHKEGNDCIKHVEIDEECSADHRSKCIDSKATCVSDGSNNERFRCQCKDGYIKVYNDGHHVCARMLNEADDESCDQCNQNEGTCYDVTDDGSRDGCLCPSTKSGENCSVEHVSVSCNVADFKMVVCYNRHKHIDFTEGLVLQVKDHEDDSMCRGHEVLTGDTDCPDWDSKLVLDMHVPLRWRCGTKENTRIPSKRRFETSITAVPLGPVVNSANSVTFNAYCEFQSSATTSFNGIDVNAVPGNDRGQHKKPTLSLEVGNNYGEPIPEGVALRLGDKIRFKINLKEDGVYSGLRVDLCTASSSAVIPDPKAVTMQLLSNGCPAAGQSVIDSHNNFRQVSTEVTNVVETGYIQVFKMSKGSSVFLHCKVKICLTGMEEDCKAVTCNQSHGRRRRSTDDEATANLTRELLWYDDELLSAEAQRQFQAKQTATHNGSLVVMEAAGFGVLLTLLLVLLLIFMVISGLLLYRLRKGNFTNPPEEGYPKPQHFALPRINRNTFRI